MEMCLDNPREGFGELFDTHPTVDARVTALVKFAGGHDPGPIALPAPQSDERSDQPEPAGPWGSSEGGQGETAGDPPRQQMPPAGTPDNPSAGGPWSDAAADPSSPPTAIPRGPWGPHHG
jgi:heat shock protein HtpX